MNLGINQILVTGATGWLGKSLVQALVHGLPDYEALADNESDIPIRCLVMAGQDPSAIEGISSRVEVVEGDLMSAEDCAIFCRSADDATLFHTAGIIHPTVVSQFYDVNLHGTMNVIDAAIAAGVRRVVVISSNSPCGCNPHPDHLFDEQSRYNPYMNYGRSKMLMEIEINRRIQEGNLDAVILRPPWFYGPNQPQRQTLFFRMIRDGKVPIVGGGENLRSMAYVDNICQAMLLAAGKADAAGETFWIADERPYSMNEIIDTVERLMEQEFGQSCAHKRTRLPGLASEIALYADAALQRLGLYQQKVHVLSEMNKTIACSIGKAKRVLGYDPVVDLEEGMRRSLKSIMETYGRI